MIEHRDVKNSGKEVHVELHELSAIELATAVRRREVTAADVLARTLERAATVDGAFVHLAPEHARAQAQKLDDDAAAGAEMPPFAGVPCPVKDLSQVKGLPFAAGSAVMAGHTAEVDDGVATLLERAGTLMIGKTTTPEFGLPCYTEPATGAPARTPWDPRRTAGGSSGGAALAVAAGVVPVAHGSDGGGSIRIPAACCGVVGMKPSRGLVSDGPIGVPGIGLVSHGVLTRTVRDTAAFLDVLSARWPGDAPSPVSGSLLAAVDAAVVGGPSAGSLPAGERPAYPGEVPPGPRGLRIGVLTEPLNCDDAEIHPEALAAVARASESLRALGHEVLAAPRPMTGADWMSFMPLWSVGAASVPIPPEFESYLMPLTRYLREMGRGFTGAQYAGATAAMQGLTRQIAVAWAGFDAILTPTLSGPPALPEDLQLADPAADFEAQKRFTPWTSVWNMTGAPSISVPLHRADVDGITLPFGVMLGGTAIGQDARLLALAVQLEAADPWPLFAPTVR